MSNFLDEGNLRFTFSVGHSAKRFETDNPHGMKSVDFIDETADCLYFIEVKDFQHPNAPIEQRGADYLLLKEGNSVSQTNFALEMGQKIKDSLLRKYALGEKIIKKIIYLLFINLDALTAHERGRLKLKISGYIPTGLNDSRFSAFTNISFDLVNAEQLKSYGITCATNIEGGVQ